VRQKKIIAQILAQNGRSQREFQSPCEAMFAWLSLRKTFLCLVSWRVFEPWAEKILHE
jgi:hypothetical protein